MFPARSLLAAFRSDAGFTVTQAHAGKNIPAPEKSSMGVISMVRQGICPLHCGGRSLPPPLASRCLQSTKHQLRLPECVSGARQQTCRSRRPLDLQTHLIYRRPPTDQSSPLQADLHCSSSGLQTTVIAASPWCVSSWEACHPA